MNMSSYKRIAITNRHLCTVALTDSHQCNGALTNKLKQVLPHVDMVILREKDMKPDEYMELAKDVIALCKMNGTECILHTFIDVARKLNHPHIHLPLPILINDTANLKDFITIGASVHSVEEANLAVSHSATYLVASHIFPTDCKPGLEPKGLKLISDIRSITDLPVYGLGGINDSNEHLVINQGASGCCRMSDYMK